MAVSMRTGMPKVNRSDLGAIKIALPPLPEQKKIARILSTWDRAIEVTERLLNNSHQQKKALMQQLLTGKKRLPGFSGEWKEIRLKNVLVEGKERNKDSAIDRVLSVTNRNGFVLPEEQFSKRVASDNVSNYKIVRKGQFGYNPSRLNVGSFARLNAYDVGILSPMYVVFRIKENLLNSNYFLVWMSSNEAKQRILSSTQGSVRDSVGFDALCSFPFKLPSTEEQQKIASVLSAADKEIEILEQKLGCLRQEKKALMQQLLTGKRRVKMDEEEIPEKEAIRA
ncbi:MAG: restriction endonuclease subunit S [Nitrosomonas sp.]|nr:restriction endonuclease subunit S [Nitrosomonas sp.]